MLRLRLEPLDLVGLGLLGAGILAVLVGGEPVGAAEATLRRILPLLAFLGTVIVLAELTSRAEVFDVVAVGLARRARGSFRALFWLCVAFAAVVTATLNLDTTAVLLTPVMLALGTRLDLPRLPLAMTTVWLANTASLLLPVSNLTNLLAADRTGLHPARFAAAMAAPELASVLATAGCLWFFYWRRGRKPIGIPERHVVADRVLFRVAAAACTGFLVLVLAGVELAVAALICTLPVVVAFAVRDRAALRWSLLPWRLLVLVTGLFLVMDTASRHGLGELLRTVLGDGALWRVSATGAVFANLVNNLPAYVALEGTLDRAPVLALLIGVNAGPIVVPWASVATLLWYERCRSAGVTIGWLRFVLTGLVTATAAVAAATAALYWL